MPAKISSGKLTNPPWINLKATPRERLKPIDINQASKKELIDDLKLSEEAVNQLIKIRKQRPIRDLDDLAAAAALNSREAAKLAGRVVGQIRPQVVLLSTAIEGANIFSYRPWAVSARFLPPTGGNVVVASLEVRWKGEPFVVQREITKMENDNGSLEMRLTEEYALPPGPIELRLTIYDSLGGASTKILTAWVLPSNPLSLFVSPANRSIYNGSVRPDWNPPNWVTGINLTFVNGDGVPVLLNQPVTWKFWDGGIGGTLVESGTFNWFEQIVIFPFGTYSGWINFTSPPGSGIFNRYEDKEDMTIEIIFQKQSGGTISGSVTCRIMAGWGINIIEVGSYSSSEISTIAAGINDARDVYENHGLTFSSVEWWTISNSQAGGYTVLNDSDEWEDLLDDWTVDNNSVDCFVVRGMWDSVAGYSPVGGPDDKDGACENDGLAVTNSLVCFAHELGHYMGDLDHADSLGSGNVMFSTCGGRNFTYDQYKEFFDHDWTRIVR